MKTLTLLFLLCLPHVLFCQSDKEMAEVDKDGAKAEKKAAKEQAKVEKKKAEERATVEKKAFKEQANELKKQAAAEYQQAIETRRSMTVDFNEVQRFPSSFVGVGARRLYRVGLGDFGPFTAEGITMYPIRLSSGYDTTSTVFYPNSVVFLMSEDFAKNYNTTLTQLVREDVYLRNKLPIGDVYFQMFKYEWNSQPYYLARIECIAVLDGFTSSVRTPVGNCSLVK